jgi:hypothetical protein
MKGRLISRRQLFVAEYLIDLNATRAAYTGGAPNIAALHLWRRSSPRSIIPTSLSTFASALAIDALSYPRKDQNRGA